MQRFAILCALLGPVLSSVTLTANAQDRETKVRADHERFQNDERWIYNRLDWAIAEAQRDNKPLLVVFRCIPCEACSQFDQKVIEEQDGISDLLDKFVCVRIVKANGLDLNQFQFDYDQSFHAIMMNADLTIYGRFGTRSARSEEEDMTIAGLRAAMERALEWHRHYPKNKERFAGKKQFEGFVDVPEAFPTLEGEYDSELDYDGNVVQSCIHCHQIRDSQRLTFRARGERIPERILYPYPLPEVLGLRMDPRTHGRVAEVANQSIAARAGFQAGDEIESFGGQPILSIADLQWVLHWAEDPDEIDVVIQRDHQLQSLKLPLNEGWRETCDISWRPTTWDLRRMATGGLLLKEASQSQRAKLKIPADRMALYAEHVGEYGEHAVAKNAGFRKGDVLIAVDGRTDLSSETALIGYALDRPVGSELKFVVNRDGRKLELSFKTQ